MFKPVLITAGFQLSSHISPHFYKVLEKVCEGFTVNFKGSEETTNSFVKIVNEIDAIAESIKITDKRQKN